MVPKQKDVVKNLVEKVKPEQALDEEELKSKIAEAAYYKAEQRGFEPSHEMEDWFEAEKEINKSAA